MISLEELNKFMKKDLENISQLYVESVLNLMESPDTITINDVSYSYDDSSLKNYTGIVSYNGKFAMSDQVQGHDNFLSQIRRDDMSDIKTNIKTPEELKLIVTKREYEKVRIWPKFKIYSFWSAPTTVYTESVKNSLDAIGADPNDYNYDFSWKNPFKSDRNTMENTITFQELETMQPTADDEFKLRDQEARRKEDEKRLGNELNKPKENTYGMEMEQPSFYSQKRRF